MQKFYLIFVICCPAFALLSHAQDIPEPIGIFDNHTDLHGPNPPGEASFDDQTREYKITCGGSYQEIEAEHLIYSSISGDFHIKVRIRANNLGGCRYNAAGFVFVFDSIDPKSMYYKGWITINNELTGYWKTRYGGSFSWGQYLSSKVHDDQLELIRQDNLLSIYYTHPSDGRTLYDQRTVTMTDPVCVGIGAGAWQGGGMIEAFFTDVELITKEQSVVNSWELYD